MVVDAFQRSAITKDGYDLLGGVPRVVKRPKIQAMAKKRREKVFFSFQDQKFSVLNELKATVLETKASLVATEYIVAAILEATEWLEWEKKFSELQGEIADVFQPPPHVSELPNDIHARILLKDAELTIATRLYACPQKYWAAWKKLLDEHEAVG